MKPTSKILPAVVIATLMGLSGAMIATAQGLEAPATTTADETVTETPVRMRHGERGQGDHGHGDHGHGDHGRGDREHGGRGGMMGGDMLRTLFTEADANADKSVSAEELASLRAAKIGAADVNVDGALSLEEFQTLWLEAMQPRVIDAFQHLDADGDASITAAEVDDLVANVMERADRNGDGVINTDDRGRRGGHGIDE